MPIHGLIFDLDGTLVKSPGIPMLNKILIDTLRELGVEAKTSVIINEFWNSGRKHRELLKNWGISDPRVFWRRFDEKDYQLRLELIRSGGISVFEDVSVLN
ncbi:MAG: hypothetical protein QW327_01005 [Candidatus Odinarchaeota archaeon]